MADGLFNLPPIVKDENTLDQLPEWLISDLKNTYNPKSNMSSPVYLEGVQGIRPYNVYTDKIGAGLGGYVDSFRTPYIVNISQPNLPDATRVLAHEAAHVQKNIAERQVANDQKNDTIARALQREARGQEGQNLRYQLEQNFVDYVNSIPFEKRSQNLVGAYGITGKHTSWEERFADLQSLESQLPRGQSLLNTPLGKQVFNTPELKRYWMQTTLPLQAKALEQNPELQQNFFDKLEIFNKTFKDEARTKSYFNAAIEALKNATNAKEKVVSPMYTDPMGMSI